MMDHTVCVIVVHRAKPGLLDEVRRRIRSTGELMHTQPGFVERLMVEGLDDANLVTTITTWKDEAAQLAWAAARTRRATTVEEDSPYTETPAATRYVISGSSANR